jgi:ubiquinone biosynthesis protein UbiJ
VSVSYRDAEPNGLAALVGGLIEGNLAAYPDRAALLRPAVIDLTGRDAEVAISLRFAEGIVEIANGVAGDAHLAVEADAAALLDLARAPLRFGFPDALHTDGRAVLAALARGDLRVRGLLRHPVRLARFSKLLSVGD